MAKTLISLQLPPTFDATVLIPLPGGDSGELTITFKHRDRTKFLGFLETTTQPEGQDANEYETALILRMAEGWGLEAEFTEANVRTLVNNYPTAAAAILQAYYSEVTGSRHRQEKAGG